MELTALDILLVEGWYLQKVRQWEPVFEAIGAFILEMSDDAEPA